MTYSAERCTWSHSHSCGVDYIIFNHEIKVKDVGTSYQFEIISISTVVTYTNFAMMVWISLCALIFFDFDAAADASMGMIETVEVSTSTSVQ